MAAESSTPTTPTPLPLLNRVAIVTGASRGIGRAIALHLATLGANIVINYSSPSSHTLAEQLISEITSLPSSPRAIAVQADVSDETQVAALFTKAEQAFGTQPHIVITCAAVLKTNAPPLSETELTDFDRIFNVNTRGTFMCIKEAAKRVKQGGGGRIVTFSSSSVGSLKPRTGVYVASKAAVEAMTRILAKEMKGSGVTVNCVAPGPVATDMFLEGKTPERIQEFVDVNPLGRIGKVEDVANVVGFLVSDAGEWVNGQVLRVNGGYV